MKIVTNISADPRKFRDRKNGRDIILQPGESISTSSPPEKKPDIFKIEDAPAERTDKPKKPELPLPTLRKETEDDSK